MVVNGGPAPRTGGLLKTIPNVGITDDDRTVFRGGVVRGSARSGVFRSGGGADAAVVDTDPVPTDRFGADAVYRQLDATAAVDRSGTWVAYIAKLRDSAAPHATSGVFRCVESSRSASAGAPRDRKPVRVPGRRKSG
jgi:hypothetical protein